MNIRKTISTELKSLKAIAQKANKALKDAPDGALVFCHKNGSVQYYHRLKSNRDSTHGTYIRSKDRAFAEKLAQAEYNRAVLKTTDSQAKLLTGFVNHYIPDPIQKVYLNMPPEKQKLIKPYVPTNEQYAQQWISQKYLGLQFNQDAAIFLTESGEKVRSKSEKMIADKLALMGIPYRYECPLRLNNTTVYPDFTLLNVKTRKVVYYEHFGMMDDPVYCNRAIKKMHDYQMNGFSFDTNLIVTFETKSFPLDLRVVEKMIKNAFASMEA